LDGFIFVNKPAGPSSFAVVKRIRKLCGGERTGHAGTLDPYAGGLLVVATGKATRLIEYIPSEPKQYSFSLKFGYETDTLDEEGNILRDGGRIPALEEIESVLPRFVGKIMQEPPRFSAIKINGRRAYKLARKNEEFSIKPREVSIFSLSTDSFDTASGIVNLTVECSAGTYVRSLAQDIARAADTLGHASRILRTAAGPFTLDNAIDYNTINDPLEKLLVPIKTVLGESSCVGVTLQQREKIMHGEDVSMYVADEEKPRFFAFDDKDELVAVLIKKDRNLFHPDKVFD
jgi:tRNA pseudouridine55 synthase